MPRRCLLLQIDLASSKCLDIVVRVNFKIINLLPQQEAGLWGLGDQLPGKNGLELANLALHSFLPVIRRGGQYGFSVIGRD